MFTSREMVDSADDRSVGMCSESNEIFRDISIQRLPNFKLAFRPYTLSMNSSIEHFLGPSELQTLVTNSSELRKFQPRKNSLKRHLEQEKVLVQPVQNDRHLAKRIRSDWDLLFYNSNDNHSAASGSVKNITTTQTDFRNKKRQSFLVRGKEMKSFFHLLEDEPIQDFLLTDSCKKLSDKYLLAMVFAYFKRAGLKIREYTRMNFFLALYLANDMEEDEEEMKYEIFPWALGEKWRDKFPKFLSKKDKLWMKIDHRAVVSRRCCDEIMAIESDHPVWKRIRPDHHGGAIRNYMKDDDDDGYPRGPNASPRICPDCDAGSGYDSASPESVSWYVSSGDSTLDEEDSFFERPDQSTFDMKGLKKTLPVNKGPLVEE